MTPESVKQHINNNVSVVLATHLFGIPCQVDELIHIAKLSNILIVEDAAPALGARFQGLPVGSMGDAAIISFHSSKVISGESGGALVINNDSLAAKVKDLIEPHNNSIKSWIEFPSCLVRKTITNRHLYSITHFIYRQLREELMYEIINPNIQVPNNFLRLCSTFSKRLVEIQFEYLEENLTRRRKIAQIYRERLSKLPFILTPEIPKDVEPAWIQYPIMIDNKHSFYKHMQQHNIDVTWTYRYSCSESFGHTGFPNTHRAAKSVLGLPTYPALNDEDAHYICSIAEKYV
jgi:dTDP-4-amino-4,6-dideoxygalactose transaminase